MKRSSKLALFAIGIVGTVLHFREIKRIDNLTERLDTTVDVLYNVLDMMEQDVFDDKFEELTERYYDD